jgi:hypothetical protein
MDKDIFRELAAGRQDLLGPLALGLVATDLFAAALGLKCPSSLFKKLGRAPDAYPPLYPLVGSHRKYMRLSDIETWAVDALCQAGTSSEAFASPIKRLGRPTKAEVREAERRGVTVPELRAGRAERGGR